MVGRRVLLVVALVLTGLLANGCAQPAKSPAASTRLPGLTLPGLRDRDPEVRLGELKGPLLINVWASYCAPCREELPIIADFARANPDVAVLGIDYEDPNRDKAIAMALASKVSYPLVSDSDGALSVKFLPQFLLIDEQGEVVWKDYVAITSRAQLEALVKEHLR